MTTQITPRCATKVRVELGCCRQTQFRKLEELRRLSEPYVNALSDEMLLPLPAWIPVAQARDNWQKTKWE